MTMSGMKKKPNLGGAMSMDQEYHDWKKEQLAAAKLAARPSDDVLLERALAILHRFGTEYSAGWRHFFRRWYYSDEPLRNDAANLVREAGFGMMMPMGTRLVGDDNY